MFSSVLAASPNVSTLEAVPAVNNNNHNMCVGAQVRSTAVWHDADRKRERSMQTVTAVTIEQYT
jgi:hypothetical protein